MKSVGQDAQEENYEDEEDSENQTNQSKTVSCFDAVSVRIIVWIEISDLFIIFM